MIKRFISLEWKSFFRSASFQTSLIFKILMGLGALYFIFVFTGMGVGLFYILKKMELDPLETVNKFAIYYILLDLLLRYFFQKMPVINIKPLLLMPFKKGNIVSYALGKTGISFFNIIHAFFFIPFTVVLLLNGYDPLGVICWHLGMMFLIYINNFINVFLNDETIFVTLFGAVMVVMAGLQYYGYFDITELTQPFFQGLFEQPFLVFLPFVVLLVVAYIAYVYFLKRLYLDAGLKAKHQVASTANLDWLDRFGKLATFLKNDIKLLRRNKRSKTTLFMSVLFLFYGLLFFTNAIEVYDGPIWRIFAGIFVSGGFLFSFGQFVPSWDSAYYPLMMTQNIRYKEYLHAKWLLVVIATAISTILCLPYLYFGWEAYMAIIVGSIFNMGVNAHLVLLGGAFIKTPIDLGSSKKAFGDKQAFNMKTLLITFPKLVLPLILYALGHYTVGPVLGFALVALSGIAGFAFRDRVFNRIIKIYKTEKYKTLAAYKQKN